MTDEAVLENFISVTGVDRERATFYLQAAGWNLQACSIFCYKLFVEA